MSPPTKGQPQPAASLGDLFGPEQRRLTLSMMALMTVASYSNLSVSAALPVIGEDLGELRLLPWVLTIELVAAAIAVLAVGPLLDAIGPRRMFRMIIPCFAVACAACALAPTMKVLVAARALQGLAAGSLIALVMTGIGLGVPERLRPRAYALNSSVWGVMGLLGPSIAAVVLAFSGWQATFWVSIPVAATAAAVGWNAFPNAESVDQPRRLDPIGLALLGAFTFVSLASVSTIGWQTIVGLTAGAAFAVPYILHERRFERPALRLRHLSVRPLLWVHLTAFTSLIAGVAVNSFLPFYMKGAQGWTTTAAAFTVVFLTVGWTTGSIISSKAQDRHRSETVEFAGSATLAAATFGAAIAVSADLALPLLFLFACLCGVGLGLVASCGLVILQNFAPREEMGRINSAHQYVRNLGFAYGAAIGGGVMFFVVAQRLGNADLVRDLLDETSETNSVGSAGASAIRSGYQWSCTAAAVVSLAGLASARKLAKATETASLSTSG